MLKKVLAVFLGVCMLFSVSLSAAAQSGKGASAADFEDLDSGKYDWCYEAFDDFIAAGIVNGASNHVLPDHLLTRAQYVVLFARLGVAGGYVEEREISRTDVSAYSDVEPGKWYAGAIHWATEKKLINGFEDGRFLPDGKLTGEQMETILYRFVRAYSIDLEGPDRFVELEGVSPWALPGVQLCSDYNLLAGFPGMISLKEPVTRAMGVKLLHNMVKKGSITL